METTAYTPTFEGQNNGQTIIIKENAPAKNGFGSTGFVFALVALVSGWIPILGWVSWAIGALLSFIGLFKAPRGLAIAGFIISFIGIFILLGIAGLMALL